MVTVRLLDPPEPQRPKMDRSCQITLEPYEAAMTMAIMGACCGGGVSERMYNAIRTAYGLSASEGHAVRMALCGDSMVTTNHSVPGIVDAPKGGAS